MKKLALVSQELEIKLIHIYVFDGKNFKPYCEEFRTNPQGVYAKTKLDGENEMIKKILLLLELLGFGKTMLRLGKEKESLELLLMRKI